MGAATKICHANINNRMQITFRQRCYYVFKQTVTVLHVKCQAGTGWTQVGMELFVGREHPGDRDTH